MYPDVASRWRRVANDLWMLHKVKIKVTEGMRDYPTQWALYAKGRTKDTAGKWIVVNPKEVRTNAMAGHSYHAFGLALDSCFQGPDPYLEKMPKKEADFLWGEYGRLVKAHGMKWGGDFKSLIDKPHCEMPYGMTLLEIQFIYEFAGIKGVWYKCNLLLNGGVKFE